MNDQAAAEMRERVAALRNKAAKARRQAEFDDESAQRGWDDAARMDQVADEYEAILETLP